MSSSNSASIADPALDLQPKYSVLAFKLMFLLHVGPVLLLPFAMQQGPAMLAILGLFMLSWLMLRRHAVFGYGPKALTRLVWHPEAGIPQQDSQSSAVGHWTLHDSHGSYEAELLPSTYVHPRLLVLNFKLKNGQRRTRALLGDELDVDSLRRLRARLLVAA